MQHERDHRPCRLALHTTRFESVVNSTAPKGEVVEMAGPSRSTLEDGLDRGPRVGLGW